MDELLKYVPQVLPFWPLLAVTLILAIVGKVLARSVFTKDACAGKPGSFYCWGYRTLSLQPIVVGALLGLVWRQPVPGVETLAESIGCFALCGAVSVWAYQVLKGLAKKQGIDISLPGTDSTLPPGGSDA